MLALTPGRLDLATVVALTGLSEDAAFGMLDAALDTGVLVVEDGRDAFRHELVR
jgi:hypothetical protein